MINCYANKVSQVYGATEIFSEISIEIKEGARIGLVGRNGEGKTTLARMIAGTEVPASGDIGWRKGITKGLLAQVPDYGDKFVYAVLEEVFTALQQMKCQMTKLEHLLAMEQEPARLEKVLDKYGRLQQQFGDAGGYEYEANIRRIAPGLGITDLLEKRWQALSGGERTKVGLACLLLKKPRLLVLDEPTNHLDLYALDWLAEWISQYKGSVLVISHDRAFLDAAVTHIWEMENGQLHEYAANYSGYLIEREERIMREFQQFADQQKKIKKMKETIKRLKEWANRANPPNAGLHRRAKSMEKALARIEVLQKPPEAKKVDLVFKQKERTGEDVVQFKQLTKAFGEKTILSNITFNVQHKERVAIVGANGSGKSTILKLILGKIQPDLGECRIGSNVSIGYLSQHVEELNPNKSVLEAFRDHVALTEGEARGQLARFLFYGFDVFKRISELSGGEKMRLRLAQLIFEKHNVLVFDEPTNHLDIDSKEVLEEALTDFAGTIIAVSHDRYFLNKLFPVTYWLENRTISRYEGSYAYAFEKRETK
ncbi:ribosomal protection-like ABC-F family protein [Shouchella patagoniensis]|uniref:ribosomal protection-like ABC-F family protein n=1 Tax=Shouchella patagoniensis TaxID=228576 RepID=UPI0009955780|nr:ABC-F family ATP-binding cassette domain-containing protein [Shouchella patagoniensis]